MIKTIILVSCAFGMFTIAAPRLVYSDLQLQSPPGSAFKMTPDPSNIWSFHEDIIPTGTKQSFPVIVDFDNNGKMDTEHKGARVMITDIQIYGTARGDTIDIADSSGKRWRCIIDRYGADNRFYEKSFTTPIVIPFGSDLKLEYSANNSAARFTVHMIGRLVTL